MPIGHDRHPNTSANSTPALVDGEEQLLHRVIVADYQGNLEPPRNRLEALGDEATCPGVVITYGNNHD